MGAKMGLADALARSSFPVPVSPRTNTVESLCAARAEFSRVMKVCNSVCWGERVQGAQGAR
jgi:hypothetical protein